jgi:hypothetical protein
LGSPTAGITDENAEEVQHLVHIDQRMSIRTIAETWMSMLFKM